MSSVSSTPAKAVIKSAVMPKPVAATAAPVAVERGHLLKGDGTTNVITITYSTTITVDDLKTLLPRHLEGLDHGITGGSTYTINSDGALGCPGNNMLYNNQGAAWMMEQTIKVATTAATALNPQAAMMARMAELEAKAAAYDALQVKLAEAEKAKAAAQAIKTAKMVATKAKQKSESASVASSGGKVEPVADAPAAKKAQVKKAAPPIKAEELDE